MAKVDGPLLSLDASGTIAGALTFSKWKGVNYVRRRVTPYNPQSSGQTTHRALFSSAVTVWQGHSAGVHTLWNNRAKELGYNMSGFNFFVQQYINTGDNPTLP